MDIYNWARRHRGAIIFALSIIVILLLIANAWKHQVLSTEWLKNQKEALAALNSIVTLFVFIAGAVFSYYRFFRGRTLSLRADPQIDVSVHPTDGSSNIHAYELSIKNVGTSTIWNPKPHLKLIIHGPSSIESEREISGWYEEAKANEHTVPVIEADERVSFFGHQQIQSEAWAVTYIASIEADSGDSWHISKTVTNAPNK